MPSQEENVVWKGRSHQIVNFWPLVLCVVLTIALLAGAFSWTPWLLIPALVPVFYGIWLVLGTKLMVFEFTSERMRIYEGVLSQNINEVELYRVKDTRIEKPFWLRIFGLSNIVLQTSDRSLPEIHIRAVREVIEIREKLRKQVELLRDKKRVREVDFEGGSVDERDLDGDLL